MDAEFTTGGLVFMICAWGAITGLCAFCFYKVFKKQVVELRAEGRHPEACRAEGSSEVRQAHQPQSSHPRGSVAVLDRKDPVAPVNFSGWR